MSKEEFFMGAKNKVGLKVAVRGWVNKFWYSGSGRISRRGNGDWAASNKLIPETTNRKTEPLIVGVTAEDAIVVAQVAVPGD